MAAKIAAFAITMLVTIAVAIVILFTMLIAMNGYSESDAMWGLGVYSLLALIVAALMSLGAFLLVGFMTNKKYSSLVSSLIAIAGFSVLGIVVELVCSLLGVGVAEIVRVNF